jgi:two-component system, NtrC family, nitrogen regulation response regulator GlnG
MPTLLIVDDEPSIRYSFQRAFEGESMQVRTARTAAEGLNEVRLEPPDVVVLDLQLPDRTGMEVFHELHAAYPRLPVIFITAHGTTETAIEAMKHGAFDYLVKPVDVDRLGQIIDRAAEAARLMQTPAMLPTEAEPDRIVGRTPVMQEMCKAIGRIAPQEVNVLIRGESGTGKELVARALYQHSARAQRPFLAINCAAIPEALLESELFGHEQGAFTGATKKHIGKFEQCDGGTLFLDEIGDMPPGLQAKMLRVLQEQTFERLGGGETVHTRVRVLAATNQDLEALVAQGRFRKDLYYRLNVVMIKIPPLRERRGDVPELAHYFLFRYDRELRLTLSGFDPTALAMLERYDWPGNVRELQSAIKQAMLHATGPVMLPEFLPDVVRVAAEPPPAQEALSATGVDIGAFIDHLIVSGKADLHAVVIAAVERELLLRVLRHTGGHQTQASELLGLNRATLRHKLKTLGLAVDRVVTEAD